MSATQSSFPHSIDVATTISTCNAGDHRIAMFMVRYDGTYNVIQSWPDSSTFTLDLPEAMGIFDTFHSSLL